MRPLSPVQYVEDPDSGCWLWQRGTVKATNGVRYGQVQHEGKKLLAHRHFYERTQGAIPEGLDLDHLCRNTLCVNPAHLEPVTHAENCRRGRQAKLTAEQVVEIKSRGSETARALGIEFGISFHTVKDIRRGRRWATA